MIRARVRLSAARLEELWKRIGAVLEGEAPLPSRIAEAAVARDGRPGSHALPARTRRLGAHRREARGRCEPGEIPEPLPDGAFVREGELWMPLCAEGETHGLLRVLDARPRRSRRSTPRSSASSSAPSWRRTASRRQVRDAEFELKARLLELESLYDLGLSLGGQLDLSALADEVLFRSISLTDAGKGTLVLLDEERGPARAERRRRAPRRAGRRALGAAGGRR